MSPFSSNPRNAQRGDVLLEALVGVVITALIGAGMAHVTARIVNNQHDTAVDALVVNELRNVMQVSGVDLCADAAPLAQKNGLPAALKGDIVLSAAACAAAADASVQIGGVSFQGKLPPAVQLTASRGEQDVLTVSSVVAPVEEGE
ncbi:hypothetical protein [Pseudoxanthomonas sp.]|uniref:hypothetical protein n=1 Tax=Pseudoxanthomonas sp. TaxID=1871049 RepID=UPI00258EEF99|nr:hypothetical protein [Pseudoxanthomonas sp.]MCR6685679.1 hypothetical protein [Pseudoxanthomonas sp.]